MENEETRPQLDMGKHVRELDALHAISRIPTSAAGQKQLLMEVLAVLRDQLGMERGMVMLLAPGSDELMIEAADGLTEGQRRALGYQAGEGITGRVIQTGKPAVVPRISQEPLFLDRVHKRKDISKEEISFICVPISIGREVIGTLSADHIFEESAPLEEDVRVLSIVASMIANDVEKRRAMAAERRSLEQENIRLRSELEDRYRPENIVGNSGAMRELYRAIHQVAGSDTTVLIRGESGTGKELVAHATHYSSPRAKYSPSQ